MNLPGKKLRERREALRLRYRDVEQASQKIATLHRNQEFAIGLSRLADIENKGTLPTVYRLYSLCAIYRLDFSVVLSWYGISLDALPADASHLSLSRTHLINFQTDEAATLLAPVSMSSDFNAAKTSFVSRQAQHWGRVPLNLLAGVDLRRNRYAYIGEDDWFMYPILFPGCFVQIDDTKRRIARDGWTQEQERPLYLVEHRLGHTCAWCTEHAGLLILQPHSSSKEPPQVYRLPGEAEILGQVVGVAMRLDLAKRRRTHS